ncbi:hypothetical protein HMPREF1321_0519 [Capnocytophaga sp. oral taxon 412 str. F0487]|jgi:hypothetical protein|uniref:Uncharacterized protein n=1 Tax=Capnocytophaga ochracea TaxID=1018 RepID=A0A2X2REH7_CAPOC|nr:MULTISPECIES: DUF6722 family protein [Capnocytophaga]AVM54179.1 signal peptidase II [Capnocytophaga sp. oral taxon 864]EIW94164.1 hypothetical protein HMPREF1321_0519 [Capnocytophaga sp. oral taxon 412 str. F0487]EJF35970.1 hypothetical protein HMPREF1320_0908 [Capnocytophaga sp. oral taxon 335 str. F0486]EKY05100.1 hypothetical protein HMPREF9078_01987 [Capnocytophaga sp. oral taxon 380 str. F0488]QLF49583.1 signal peptidase II [Capnocytophaga sp. oral taxon 902]
MKKRISDFLLDVSKYVFAGLLIAPLFNSTFACNDAYWCAFTVAILALIVGLFLSKQKKGAVNKNNNNNRNKNYRKNNNSRNNTTSNRA